MNYQAQLESAVNDCGVTGASFAYWDGNVLHTAVAGDRNSVTGDPVTTDTLMHIGSITKILNAALLMQVVDEGQIRLSDPIVSHLPELRLRDMGALAQIDCKMLLNHTSGIDCDILPDHGPDQERIVDAIKRCADFEQLHEPGAGPSYCNIGTVIAGFLTQKLRGSSWYTLIKERIYRPLEMRHSLADFADLPRFRVAVGDVTDPNTGKLVQTRQPFYAPSFAPCGTTLMMSATDLVTVARCIMGNGTGENGSCILSSESASRMREPTARMVQPAGWSWGLGWMIMPGGVLSHSGGGPGISSALYAHPTSGRVLALLTNCDRWEALHPSIVDPILLSWTGAAKQKHPEPETPQDQTSYTGVFENQLMSIEVFNKDAGLCLRTKYKKRAHELESVTGYPSITLTPTGRGTFVGSEWIPGMPNMQFQFIEPAEDGRMQYLAFMFRLLARTV